MLAREHCESDCIPIKFTSENCAKQTRRKIKEPTKTTGTAQATMNCCCLLNHRGKKYGSSFLNGYNYNVVKNYVHCRKAKLM